MPEQIQSQNKNINPKRPRNILRLIYVLLFLLIAGFIISRIFLYKTPQEQLAEIEKSLAIPDSENAAILYNQLFEDYNNSDLEPVFLTPTINDITRSRPWTSKEYPQVAKWLEDNKDIFDKLLQTSKYEKCIFPIPISSTEEMTIASEHLALVRRLTFWLIRSANNDYAEGRIEQALEKYKCCIHMGRHFSLQPVTINFLVGIAIEAIGLQGIRNIILYEDATAEQLETIETALPDTKFQLDKHWKLMMQVEYLYSKIIPATPPTNFLSRLKLFWTNRQNNKATMKRVKEIYLRLLTDRHGTQVLIALKNYKKNNGKWPENLDEIKTFLSSENILIDPQNKGSFIYKLKGDSFILYSKGLNGIDENGVRKAPADDWMIWPTEALQAQSKMASTQISDPNTK